MPIMDLLKAAAFDNETIELLAEAFEAAWQVIQKSGSPLASPEQSAATRERVAKNIIEAAQNGERSRTRLVDEALARLALRPR